MDGTKQPIQIWKFEDAPEELQKSAHDKGMDGEWIGLIPKCYANSPEMARDLFCFSDRSETTLLDGSVLLVGGD
jgi:hypothetical protein